MAYTTIDKGSSYFNTLLYTGNGSTLTISGNNFQPDFTWIKERSAAGNHKLADVVRGATKYLSSNLTNAEDTTGSGIQSWNSTGFSVSNATDINDNGQTYVSWNWLASNTSGSSNYSGTITSTVSANTTAGFSIVSYTGNATAGATVGHGLGAVPSMIITKARTISDNWGVYHKSLGATKALYLNTTNAQITSSAYYNNTAPSSTVVTLGENEATNDNAGMIMYAFAEVKGYSKFGSYTGNGSTDGTFVYTGFKPAFLLIKTSSSNDGWQLIDAKRNLTNGYNNSRFETNSAGAEAVNSTWTLVDILSNGFKQRYYDNIMNASGVTYIYMAFAENPFVTSTGIPTTAR